MSLWNGQIQEKSSKKSPVWKCTMDIPNTQKLNCVSAHNSRQMHVSTVSDECDCILVKIDPNFQGILNWIIQILDYYCRKQHKNIENSQIYWTRCWCLSLPFSLFTATCVSFTFLSSRVFSVLGQSTPRNYVEFWTSQVFIRAL